MNLIKCVRESIDVVIACSRPSYASSRLIARSILPLSTKLLRWVVYSQCPTFLERMRMLCFPAATSASMISLATSEPCQTCPRRIASSNVPPVPPAIAILTILGPLRYDVGSEIHVVGKIFQVLISANRLSVARCTCRWVDTTVAVHRTLTSSIIPEIDNSGSPCLRRSL